LSRNLPTGCGGAGRDVLRHGQIRGQRVRNGLPLAYWAPGDTVVHHPLARHSHRWAQRRPQGPATESGAEHFDGKSPHSQLTNERSKSGTPDGKRRSPRKVFLGPTQPPWPEARWCGRRGSTARSRRPLVIKLPGVATGLYREMGYTPAPPTVFDAKTSRVFVIERSTSRPAAGCCKPQPETTTQFVPRGTHRRLELANFLNFYYFGEMGASVTRWMARRNGHGPARPS